MNISLLVPRMWVVGSFENKLRGQMVCEKGRRILYFTRKRYSGCKIFSSVYYYFLYMLYVYLLPCMIYFVLRPVLDPSTSPHPRWDLSHESILERLLSLPSTLVSLSALSPVDLRSPVPFSKPKIRLTVNSDNYRKQLFTRYLRES